jgi:hypothetical protein
MSVQEPRDYRKRPVVLQARQLGRGYDEDVDIMRWCGGRPIADEFRGEDANLLFDVPTLEGSMQARIGDWIVCGIKGEYYPVKPDIFAELYEPEARALTGASASEELSLHSHGERQVSERPVHQADIGFALFVAICVSAILTWGVLKEVRALTARVTTLEQRQP